VETLRATRDQLASGQLARVSSRGRRWREHKDAGRMRSKGGPAPGCASGRHAICLRN